jgi:hypothetical protein
MAKCKTHHHACDCREEEHAQTIADLQATIDQLRIDNKNLISLAKEACILWKLYKLELDEALGKEKE